MCMEGMDHGEQTYTPGVQCTTVHQIFLKSHTPRLEALATVLRRVTHVVLSSQLH